MTQEKKIIIEGIIFKISKEILNIKNLSSWENKKIKEIINNLEEIKINIRDILK